MQLSAGQDAALKAIRDWYNEKNFKNRPYFYLAGYAGTGKTTIEQYFTNDVQGRLVRAAFTGKAALRMQEVSGRAASTVHSIAYKLGKEKKEVITGNLQPTFKLNTVDSPLLSAKLLVLDECSMIDDKMGNDLLSFHCPILVLGDPGQLPPIQGAGFFNKKKPDFMLTEVHRQALDSDIIRVATAIRSGTPIIRGSSSDANIYPYSKDYDLDGEMLEADQILTGTNRTRTEINKRIRELHGYDNKGFPVEGEKLICLRNNRKIGLFNGLSGTVSYTSDSNIDRVNLHLNTDIGPKELLDIHPQCFTDMKLIKEMPYVMRNEMQEFDYGYCITVHKSQGSQWDNVLLLDDNFLQWRKDDRMKWLYTAVTRAAKKITIIRK